MGALLLLGMGTGHGPVGGAAGGGARRRLCAGDDSVRVGQAAFTVTIVVLFNLLVPVGWKVGLLRVEDVAIGCAVSPVVGVLFWPRGAAALVGDDLADAFRLGAEYLTQAVDWALSEDGAAGGRGGRRDRGHPAGGRPARLPRRAGQQEAQQGRPVGTGERVPAAAADREHARGAAATVSAPGVPPGAACLPLEGSVEYGGAPACMLLRSAAAGMAEFYGHVADEMGHPGRSGDLASVPAPAVLGPAVPGRGPARVFCIFWNGAAALGSEKNSGDGAGAASG